MKNLKKHLFIVLTIPLLGFSFFYFFDFSPSETARFEEVYINLYEDKDLSREAKKSLRTYKEAYDLYIENYIYEVTDEQKEELIQTSIDSINNLILEDQFTEELQNSPKELLDYVMSVSFGAIDAHTAWIDAKDANSFSSQITGNYEGIGILFNAQDDQSIIVIKVFDESPAFIAGIMEGDIIHEVNGESTKEMPSLRHIVESIKGPEGSEVNLTITREGKDIQKTVRRGSYYVASAEMEILDNNYLYFPIYSFGTDTAAIFRNGVHNTDFNNIKGLIIDVRSNPGGLLSSVVSIADSLLTGEEVVSVKGSRSVENNIVFRSIEDADIPLNIPIVILTNSFSASASELLAGSLGVNNRATIMGDTTFGKWSVQTSYNLKDGSIFNVTTQIFYAPENKTFQGYGIYPDILISPSEQEEVFREFNYENYLVVDESQKENNITKLTIKEEECPEYYNNLARADDKVLGCAVLFLDKSANINSFKSSVKGN